AYDLLAAAGLPAAETAFYEVLVDYGAGPASLGLYTAVEVIDDTVIGRVFGGDSGNIYEGDGAGVSLAAGTFDQIAASFPKENNQAEADWSDLEALYTVLNSGLRLSDPAAWRAQLDAVFDTDGFLEWLALSAVIQHWDTYGAMSHNFYLYHDPATDQLTWISWDHNFVLGAGPGGAGGRGGPGDAGAPPAAGAARPAGPGAAGGGRGGMGSVSLDKAEVGENWPLIRYLLDDPEYAAQYYGYLDEVVNGGVFNADTLAAEYQRLAALAAPYASDAAAFETAVQALTDQTAARVTAVREFLAAR
nr:CotH kinase family protein [Anaerolineales bacterium]